MIFVCVLVVMFECRLVVGLLIVLMYVVDYGMLFELVNGVFVLYSICVMWLLLLVLCSLWYSFVCLLIVLVSLFLVLWLSIVVIELIILRWFSFLVVMLRSMFLWFGFFLVIVCVK